MGYPADVSVVRYEQEAESVTAVEDTIVNFALVEVKPTFQGGDGNAFSKWVGQNLHYPEEAKKADVSGRVTLQFVIETDGTLTFLQILRAPDGDKAIGNVLANESKRVVSSSPKWTCGKQDGKPVKVVYNFPVIFQLR